MTHRTIEWLKNGEHLLLVGLIAVHLVPVWGFTYFPSQDGPTHVENADIIRTWGDADRAISQEYYFINDKLTPPSPNWVGHLVLAALLFVFSPGLAEKLFLSGYVILFPLAVRYALGAIRADARWLAVLCFPFILNYMLYMGLYNFSYSLAIYFLLVGWWLRRQESMGLRQAVVLFGLTGLTYFTHPFAFGMAALTMFVTVMWFTARDLRARGTSRQEAWRKFRSRGLMTLLGLAPALIGGTVFALSLIGPVKGAFTGDRQTAEFLWQALRGLYSLISHNQELELVFTTMVAVLFAAIVAYLLVTRIRKYEARWDFLLIVVAATLVLYFALTPIVFRQGMIKERFNLYPFLVLMLWMGAQPFHPRAKLGIQILAAALAVTLVAARVPKHAEISDYLAEYATCREYIEDHSTVLPIAFGPDGAMPGRSYPIAGRIAVFMHAAGYVAAGRPIIEFSNYEARNGQFPTVWRHHVDPYRHIGRDERDRLENYVPTVDFIDYHLRTGGRVDYVLVWTMGWIPRDPAFGPRTKSILEQLDKGYEPVFTSKRGFARLFRRKNWDDYKKAARARKKG